MRWCRAGATSTGQPGTGQPDAGLGLPSCGGGHCGFTFPKAWPSCICCRTQWGAGDLLHPEMGAGQGLPGRGETAKVDIPKPLGDSREGGPVTLQRPPKVPLPFHRGKRAQRSQQEWVLAGAWPRSPEPMSSAPGLLGAGTTVGGQTPGLQHRAQGAGLKRCPNRH